MRKWVWFALAIALAALPCARGEEAYQLHQWIELIGFDNTKPDYGVADHLARVGQKPTAIALLFSTNRLFLMHAGMEKDYALPARACSYFGRQHNSERRRQDWTAHQVRALVKELRSRGIDVFASFFNFRRMPTSDETIDDESAKLVRFLKDYGFSGFHAADGYSPPCHVLDECPDAERPKLARANAVRFADNVKRMVAALKAKGFKVYANSCWTKDPYEALFRYGVDYRLLATTGIDGLYVESSAASQLVLGYNAGHETSPLDRNQAMLLRLKAAMPNVPFVLLHAINDGQEQWSAVRNAMPATRAEALNLANVFYGDRRIIEGFLSCLSDGLTANEWAELRKAWKLAFTPAKGPIGVRVVWSDKAFDAEFDACAVSRDANSGRLLAELIARGAVVNGIVSAKDALADESLPLLVANPQFFPSDELAALRRRMAPVVEVGRGAATANAKRPLPYRMISEAERHFPGMPNVQYYWRQPLHENLPAEKELWAAVDRINSEPLPYAPSGGEGIRSWAVRLANGRLGVFARNASDSNLKAKITMLDSEDVSPTDVQVHTDFPSVSPRTALHMTIPPQDAVFLSLGDFGAAPPGQPVAP